MIGPIEEAVDVMDLSEGDAASGPTGAVVGRVAAVTGASRGLGRACALRLAQAGADVALFARDAEALAAVAQDIRSMGRRAWCFPGDITHLDKIVENLGDLPSLDILVNNAGMNVPQPFLDVDHETFDAMMQLNVRSAFFIAQAAARIMVAKGKGSIVNMSSQAGHVGLIKRTVYCTTKFAIEGMTRAMCVDLAGTGVRVNTVAPTFVRTDLTAAQLEKPEFREYVESNILSGRLAEEGEVAAAVLFLASDDASMVNGISLPVDGGWLAH